MGKTLTRDDILGATTIRTQVVPVPEWGGEVTIRELTGEEREWYENDVAAAAGNGRMAGKLRARLVAMSVVNGNGERTFQDQDVVALSQKSARALIRVWRAACVLSALRGEDVEDLAKNSDSGPGDDSSSGSPSP